MEPKTDNECGKRDDIVLLSEIIANSIFWQDEYGGLISQRRGSLLKCAVLAYQGEIIPMFDFEKGKVRFIRGGKYPQSNSVLIDDNIRTIIDPACNEEKLLSIHRERPIEVVINSHGHEDHILYNWLFPDAQLWVHKLDAGVFKDMDVFIHQFFPAR